MDMCFYCHNLSSEKGSHVLVTLAAMRPLGGLNYMTVIMKSLPSINPCV